MKIFFWLFSVIFFLSGNMFGYNEEDVNTLKKTGQCRNGDFSGANLNNITIYDATGSNFTDSTLTRCDLGGACLDQANFKSARFYNTNLNGFDLSDPKFKDVRVACDPMLQSSIENEELRTNLAARTICAIVIMTTFGMVAAVVGAVTIG